MQKRIDARGIHLIQSSTMSSYLTNRDAHGNGDDDHGDRLLHVERLLVVPHYTFHGDDAHGCARARAHDFHPPVMSLHIRRLFQ